MPKRITLCLSALGLVFVMSVSPLLGYDGLISHIKGKLPAQGLEHVARSMDCIQEALVNKGTVVIKQPDIWSQGRMTKYRKEFENKMAAQLDSFDVVLAGRIARSDAAGLSSQTAVGASLSPVKDNVPIEVGTADAVRTERDTAFGYIVKNGEQSVVAFPKLDNAPTTDFKLLNAQAAKGNSSADGKFTNQLALGLEPNVRNDQLADYLTHLQRTRRVNLGDDNTDSAGYTMCLMRVPISVQPGDKTKKGFGAMVNLTMTHDFGPRFLQATYRNLVINDLVDQLGPVVHELIRCGQAKEYRDAVEAYAVAKNNQNRNAPQVDTPRALSGSNEVDAHDMRDDGKDDTNSLSDAAKAAAKAKKKQKDILRAVTLSRANYTPASRTGARSFSVAPSDLKRVFVEQNLLNLAFATQEALDLVGKPGVTPPDPNKVRITEVRSYLRQELQGAYDLMEGRCKGEVGILSDIELVENLAEMVYCRKFEGPKGAWVDSDGELNDFYIQYESFTHRLPGNVRFRPIGALSWAIAIEAGLLNRQLREDMKQTKGNDGWIAPPEIEGMTFYVPDPAPEVEQAFLDYVKARWPMITFALEPVVDQQNIEAGLTRRRDLQLAIAFALSSGRISFRQAITYNRQLQFEAQTIELNQTVAAFANGNDTFGWRISPRFQLPPDESNLRAIPNLLLRGGPGPNYQLDNSKIEPGLREMTAVVVMPSFVRGVRIDVSSDWYKLSDPDERKIHTAQAVALGRKLNETREALDAACKCGKYRPEDTQRLRAKLHQLETMLPLQSSFVKIPYENTLGGFALFSQGAGDLVPELNGFEGIHYIDPDKGADILVYGKHFSIYESTMVVGGKNIPRDGSTTVLGDGTNTLTLRNTIDPPRNSNGDILLLDQNRTPVAAPAIKDPGAFDILSREVIRLRIPPGVAVAERADGSQVVEAYISTSTGISSKLQIPVQPPDAAATGPAFKFLSTNLPIHVTPGQEGAADKFDVVDSTKILIQAAGWKQAPPASIDLSVRVALGVQGTRSKELTIKQIPLNPTGDTYIADKAILNLFAKELSELSGTKPQAEGWITTSVTVTPSGASKVAYPMLNPLKITFSNGSKLPAADPVTARKPANPTIAAQSAKTRDAMTKRTTLSSDRPSDPTLVPAASPEPPQFLPPLPARREVTQEPAQPTAAPPATPAPSQIIVPNQTLLVVPPQRQPSINVNVPVTNNMPAKKHMNPFRRASQTPGVPAVDTPTVRGPLLERLRGRP